MRNSLASLFMLIVYFSLGITAFIVIIGGVVCIQDDDYSFSEYVVDVGSVYRLLAAAVAAAVGQAWATQKKESA